MICIRIGNRIGTVAVASRSAANANRNDAAKLKGLVGSCRIAVVVKSQLCLKALVHCQILLYIPLGSLRTIRTTLTPEIRHVGQSEVSRRNFLAQSFLTGRKQRLTFFILCCARLPYIDACTAVGRIHDPDLFACLLNPFVCKAAVGADLTRAVFRQRVDRIAAQTSGCALCVDVAVGTRECAGRKLCSIGCGHRRIIRSAVIAVGGIDHTVGADNRLISVALAAAHITLSNQKQQRNRCGGDIDFIKHTVHAHLGGADARSHESIAVHSHNRGVENLVLLYTIANLIGGGCARIDDFHCLAADVVMIVIVQRQGFEGFFLAAHGANTVFIGVFTVENVNLIIITDRPHRNTDDCSTRGSCQIPILRKLFIDLIGTHCFQQTFRIKPCSADSVDAAAVCARRAEGCRINPIPFNHREGHGVNLTGAVNTPAIHGVILRIVLQFCPQVGTRTNAFGQLLQVIFIHRLHAALRCDHKIAGHFRDAYNTIFVNITCNVHAAHGDGHGDILACNRRHKGSAVAYALIIAQAAFRTVQAMDDGMDNVFTRFHLAFAQQHIHYRCGNVVHARRVGVDAVGQIAHRDAAVPQIHIGNAVMLANLCQHRIGLCQLICGVIGLGVCGQHGNNRCLRIIIAQAQQRMYIAIRQIIPLFGCQIYGRRCRARIKGAYLGHMRKVVGAAVEQNHIGSAVGPHILNSGQIVHSGIFTGRTGRNRMSTADGCAAPAVIDTQLGIQCADHLHPPGFIDIGQQIVLRITGQMIQIEAIGHGDISREGGNGVTQNGDDLAFIVCQIGMLCAAFCADTICVGVSMVILPHFKIRHLIDVQSKASAADVRKCKILARQVHIIRVLQDIINNQIGRRTNPRIINKYMDSIAAVVVYHILKTIYMGF